VAYKKLFHVKNIQLNSRVDLKTFKKNENRSFNFIIALFGGKFVGIANKSGEYNKEWKHYCRNSYIADYTRSSSKGSFGSF
jgi:hypothetical protein